MVTVSTSDHCSNHSVNSFFSLSAVGGSAVVGGGGGGCDVRLTANSRCYIRSLHWPDFISRSSKLSPVT